VNSKTDPLIICENLVKIYKVADLEVVALQGLDLVVDRGEMLGIVGASGSGKSTLMNILGGLDRPSAGRVTVDGLNLLGLPESALNEYQRAKVGFVWQQTSRNLIPYLTAQENIELPMTMYWNLSAKEKKEWAVELLSAVGLYERRQHRLAQLSGGEQQRVAIAVALANKPVLLLGDEPTGEVDSATAQIVMDTFRRLGRLMDLTIIIVTHDPRIAGQVDRVVSIRDGKISTETVRHVTPTDGSSEHLATDAEAIQRKREEVTYHEYVVLDSAGRVQVPKEILEELGIGKRAQMETGENCIIIRPADDQGNGGEGKRLTLEEQLAILFKDQEPPPVKTKRGLRDRLHLSERK
jgi:putative ABC transport system ATP-binding protein